MSSEIENSLIIPVFNGTKHLTIFWESLISTIENDTEIILVDDGSTENILNSMPSIKDYISTKVLTHKSPAPKGFSASVNSGLKECQGKYIYILNSDLILQKNCLASLKQTLKSDNSIGIVGAKLIYPQTGTIQHAGIAFSETNHFHIFRHAAKNHPLACKRRIVQAVAFALCCFPKDIYKEIGELNESYFNSYEDFDYCFRTLEKNLKIVFDPNAIAYHWERQSGVIRSVLRKDNVARLWRDWGPKIIPDLKKYIIENFDNIKEANSLDLNRSYIVINLSKGYEDQNIIDILYSDEVGLKIEDVWHFKQRNNNLYNLWLPQILPIDSIRCNHSFIYLVDEYPQIFENTYWFNQRFNYSKDELILDHNANIEFTNSFFGSERRP